MTSFNQLGLSRNIPSEVKREVRKRSGFGCVICGSAIVTYEHIEPEFKDAKCHDSNGITLLCASCHLRKTKGLLSPLTVKDAMKRPKTFEQGFAKGLFDEGTSMPEIQVGNVRYIGGTSVLSINSFMLLGFDAPEEDIAPVRLNARFFDNEGVERFRIYQNEFFAHPYTYDVESIGARVVVRNQLNQTLLLIEHIPRQSLVIRRANIRMGPYEMIANDRGMQLKFNSKNVICLSGGTIEGPIAFEIEGNQFMTRDMTFTGLNRIDMEETAML